MRTSPCLLLALATFAAHGAAVDLAHPTAAVKLTPTGATLDPTVRKAADGSELVAVTYQPAAAPTLALAPASGTWAWPASGTLRLKVQNGMPWPVTLIVDVASGEKHLKAIVGVNPGPPQMLSVPLTATSPRAFGMQVGPPMPFSEGKETRLVALQTDGAIDAAKVTGVSLSMPQPGAAQTLLFGKVDVVEGQGDLKAAYTGIVDQYGQYTRGTWPEKVDSDEALKRGVIATKVAPTGGAGAAAGLDKYGGRTDMPAMQASGFFRVQKQGARWWLVTPEGHAFFSLGVNAVNHTDGHTYVQGREFMFTGQPPATGPFVGTGDSRSDNGSQRDNGMNHGRWWDVYSNNLARTLGNDFDAGWRKRTLDRLQGWHFNTLGNWSDPAFATDKRMAYTVPILIRGDFNTVGTGYDYWGRMPDPFDPRFAKAAQQAIASATKSSANDPWLLGYFADNELAWAGQGPQGRWALATGSLAQGPQSPAKQAFLAYLKKTHGDVAAFAKAWGINASRWDDIAAQGFKAPDPNEAHPAIAADYIAFLKLYAGQYFRTVAETLKKADPHHLFLGGRLAVRTPEVEEMSAKYTDVTSINTYVDVPEHGFDVAEFKRWDKPVMLTEFHFGSNDRGPFGNGVAAVANEGERGKAYARFVDAAAATGIVVGTHWFQYVDQPVTGRVLDGENAHIGLVGITDIPFEGFTRAAAETNARVGGGSGGGSHR
ncbi:beta-galactosidase [Luteibacter yeojuensis]|uniref:Beta-agarase n=1 Tax=Luteibacter yeojuensis TaxID=345309 RepID=A0A0F3KFZ8_9GAMM|nr:beta-galactosidase [Luteibacter yeojuensis]KJV30071.1 beta-agarase [Luteibacter yeojuensis]